MTRRGQGGFSLIELMVSMAVAALAVGFIFRIYATSSMAYRTQSQVAELQQSLRTAKQAIASELRKAGYFASSVETAIDTGVAGSSSSSYALTPVQITNSSTGPDELRLVYADTNCLARIKSTGPPFNAAVSEVEELSCFQDGDIAIAVRTANGEGGTKRGQGCILKVTGLVPGGPKLQHNPGAGAPYNQPTNSQCGNIEADWNDGYTVFVKFQAKAYRIKPADPRGVLQVSQSGGLIADWEDLAFGFVEMQFAVQMYEPGDLVDLDGLPGPDGNLSAEYDWYSGENMEALDTDGGHEFVQVRMSLIARTVAEVDGPGTLQTASLIGDETNLDNNEVGDRDSVLVSDFADDPTSPYYGSYSYRMVSTVIDLRNLGVGRQQ